VKTPPFQASMFVMLMAAGAAVTAMPTVAAEPQAWEVGGGLGFIDPGGKRNIDGDPAALLTFGTRFNGVWGGEVAAMLGNDISLLGVRALYHFTELPGTWIPYASAGLAITDPKPGENDTTALIGVGVKHPLSENLGLRAEVNAHQGFDSGTTDTSIFVGVTWSWGGGSTRTAAAQPVAPAERTDTDPDTDGDGVLDSKDRCPRTRTGAQVNSEGCPLDTDGDGVLDSMDSCPGTPAGDAVDSQGCRRDADADGDGIPDSADRCAGTPAGASVSADGCEAVTTAAADGDNDGVPDASDRCADTPSGAKVDADGCTLALTEKTSITLMLNFDTDQADIKPEFADDIGKVAEFMRQYPGASVVIEGHSDNTGNPDYNQRLSQRRAEAVAEALVNDHGVARDRVKAVGYGDTRPVADNSTAAGRAQNRRVEAAIEEAATR
jgi:OmpA-OmpF porin, OOP family